MAGSAFLWSGLMSHCFFAQPYLKWPGSKRKLIAEISATLPTSHIHRLIEPFVGSGAVALALPFERAILSDVNADLIATHQQAISDPSGLITRLEALFAPENNNAEAFLRLREEFNSSADPARRVELFVYLNRHCFNGLVRFSKSGRFNTPFGKVARPYLPAKEIHEFSRKLREAIVEVSDFRDTMAKAGMGDFVYCDPPYLPLTDSSNFTAYSAGGFSSEAHEELVMAAQDAAERGATVVIANHDTPHARKIYCDADEVRNLRVLRTVSCKGDGRGKVPELMAIYRPPTSIASAFCSPQSAEALSTLTGCHSSLRLNHYP